MTAHVLPEQQVDDLDTRLCDKHGRLKINSSAAYARVPWEKLRLWTHLRAFYGLPTPELVSCIKQIIGTRSALEIGAGNGCLGRALSIPMTDSHVQADPAIRLYYLSMGQPTVEYGADVEALDALEAVCKYKPQVVVGSWITQKSDGTRPGSFYGVDEEKLLDEVETYVVFGSLTNHGNPDVKAILSKPHKVLRAPWMWSRAKDSALFIWDRV